MDDKRLQWDYTPKALTLWQPDIKAASESDNAIDIYGAIGIDAWTGEGTTASMVSAALKRANGAPVEVNINSAGGNFFEGLAIHTLLSDYKGEVTVNVVGLAASAASLIALAGDRVNIAENGFFMIHNAWTVVIGNKADMREVADVFEKFDDSMAALYADKTGIDKAEIAAMMADETYLSGAEAVDRGFADDFIGSDKIKKDEDHNTSAAIRKMDVALAKSGMPRSERRALLKEITSTPCATVATTPCASDELGEALSALLSKVTTHH